MVLDNQFRDTETVKPRIFKVFDHQPDHTLVEEAIEAAASTTVNLNSTENRSLFLKAYNRKRLALASTSKALKNWSVMPGRSEPADTDIFANWLNTQSNLSLASDSGIILDFKRPIILDLIIIPDKAM